jgi:hypothetical protein
MPANIAITFNTSTSESTTHLVDARFTSSDNIALQKSLSATQADLIFEQRGTAEATPTEIDLGLVSDQNGALAVFATVKALIICNKGEENPLSVYGSYFGDDAAITVPAGGALTLLLPEGVEITPASNDKVKIGSAQGTEYELRIVGQTEQENQEE